jgi:hypothetical protein
MSQPAAIDMAGWFPSITAVPLSTGWNLVGYSGAEMVDVSDSLSAVSTKWNIVWHWNAGGWYLKQRIPSGLPIPRLAGFEAGKAYWIKVRENAVWSQ